MKFNNLKYIKNYHKVLDGRFGSMMFQPSRPGIWRRSSTVYLEYRVFGGTIKSVWTAAGAGAASRAGAGLGAGGGY